MTNRQLEEKIRGAFDRTAPDLFEDLSASATSEKGSVEMIKFTKKNRQLSRFAALAATLVLVAGIGYGVRANFRPANPEMPTFSNDTGSGQLTAEPETPAPVEPIVPEVPVQDSSVQLEDPTPAPAPGVPLAPSWPVEPETPAAPMVPMAPPVPEAEPDPRIKIALELARNDAGVEETDVTQVTLRNIDEQTGIVELDFYTEDWRYRYRVNVTAVVADQVMKLMSGDKAMEIAFSHAGVDPLNTKVMQMLLDDLADPAHYDYTFVFDGYEYVYEINAATGAVLKAEKNPYTAPETPVIPSKPLPVNPVAFLSTNQVIEIACTHAGVPSDKIGPMELTMDDAEAVRHYDLKFQYDGAVYFYEIEASNGEILTWQKSAYTGTEFVTPPSVPYPSTPAVPVDPVQQGPTEGPVQPVNPVQPVPAPVPAEPQLLTGVVPQERAVQIALDHAKVEESAVRELTAELDFSDNLGHYRIEFKTDTTQYLYKVHYGAGNIMEWTEADAG